jgi:hypothetical protein
MYPTDLGGNIESYNPGEGGVRVNPRSAKDVEYLCCVKVVAFVLEIAAPAPQKVLNSACPQWPIDSSKEESL